LIEHFQNRIGSGGRTGNSIDLLATAGAKRQFLAGLDRQAPELVAENGFLDPAAQARGFILLCENQAEDFRVVWADTQVAFDDSPQSWPGKGDSVPQDLAAGVDLGIERQLTGLDGADRLVEAAEDFWCRSGRVEGKDIQDRPPLGEQGIFLDHGQGGCVGGRQDGGKDDADYQNERNGVSIVF